MYKVISFDIGGTLLENESSDKYNLSELAKLLDLPKNNVRLAYKNVFQKRNGTLLELVTLFCKVLNIEITDEIITFFKEKYSDKNNRVRKNSSASKVIQDLKNMGYKIILFSNNCCLVNTEIDADIMKNIDKIFYSYNLGYTKSDSESYRIVEKEMGVKSDEVLHIGDTFNSDYIKPRENGWDSLYYGNIDDSNIQSIESLDKLIEILRGNCLWKKRK